MRSHNINLLKIFCFNSLYVPLLAVFFMGMITACIRPVQNPQLNREMRDLEKITRSLYSYSWNSDRFTNKRNEAKIKEAILRLSQEFHQLERKTYSKELGFRVAINSQTSLVEQIAENFVGGRKEKANRQLRNIASNCIACHSRFKVEENFFGSSPPFAERSVDNDYSIAEFYFAGRQFEKSSQKLMQIVQMLGKTPAAYSRVQSALELWLVIQVRVYERHLETAGKLRALSNSILQEDEEYQAMLFEWVDELEALPVRPENDFELIDIAIEVLGKDFQESLDNNNGSDVGFVRTLWATALLHRYLEQDKPRRKEAALLLALAYQNLPIRLYDAQRDLYLEQVIREFPQTAEAEHSFRIYNKNIRFVHGKTLPASTLETVQELARLAGAVSSNR